MADGLTDERREFQVMITYFKPNGKYYTDTAVRREFRVCGPTGGVNMNDVVDWMRVRLRDGPGGMPGLSTHSAGWDGHILLECDDGYPVLLPNLTRDEGEEVASGEA